MFQNNLLMAADAATSGGGAAVVSVGNSALYNTANSENLTYTEQAGTSTNKQYISFWMYFTGVSTATNFILSCDDGSNNNRFQIYFGSTITVLEVKASSVQCYLISTRQLRDIGWYHIELLLDTTQADAASRNILKVNNVRLTEFSTETNFTLNDTFGTLGSAGKTFHWGRSGVSGDYLGAYLAESVRIDGDPAGISTGEYDTTGLFWTPKSSTAIKELTFGNNGFYLDNTTNAQTDASGEGNNFTNNNTVVTSTHTPTNIHSLLNPLSKDSGITISNGSRTSTTTSAGLSVMGTLSVSAGTYYWEVDIDVAGGAMWTGIGYVDGYTDNQTQSIRYRNDGSIYKYNVEFSTGNASLANGNILGFAYDTSALTLAIYHNNTLQDTVTGVDNIPHHISLGFNNATCTIVTEEDNWTYTAPSTFVALNTTNIASATSRTASDTNKYFQTTLYEGNGAGQRVGAFQPFDNTFTVAKSALFPTSDGNLSKTFGAAGNQKKWTFSTWLKKCANGTNLNVFRTSHGNDTAIQFQASNKLQFYVWDGSSYLTNIVTTDVYQDTSQWFHLVLKWDSTPSTPSASSIAFYVNGVQVTALDTAVYPSQNVDSGWNGNGAQTIGIEGSGSDWDGYMSEIVFIDNDALAASSFGQTDTSTNRWIPKDVSGLTYGTNGFYLNFSNASDLGEDQENSNDWTNNNSVVQVTDSPTTNFGTLAVKGSPVTLTNGNRTLQGGAGGYGQAVSGLSFKHEKIFCALLIVDGGSGASVGTGMAVVPDNYVPDPNKGAYTDSFGNVEAETLTIRVVPDIPGTAAAFAHAIAPQDGDYFTCAVDPDQGNIWFGFYDTSAGTHQYLPSTVGGTAGNPADGTLPTVTGRNFNSYAGVKIVTTGYSTGSKSTLCLASGDLPITPPTDFLTFQQDNLTGTEQFQSAMSWIKNRDATDNHMLFDRVRGATKDLPPNDSDAEVTNVNTLQSFLEAGAQIGNDVEVNTASESYVLWNWMAEATGSGASNEAGSINTTSTLVDQTLGLSISKYTGTGSNATVGHGLGVAPEMIIVKRTDSASGWYVQHTGMSATQFLQLNDAGAAAANAAVWNSAFPTSTIFNIGTNAVTNASSATYLALCFAPSQFISIGSYEGNGSADGAFISTVNSLGVPIQPVWAITKSIDSTSNWDMYDKERLGYNPENAHLDANLTTVESTADNLDIVTGGLKMRISTDPNVAETYVYMAIGTPIIDTDGRIIAGR